METRRNQPCAITMQLVLIVQLLWPFAQIRADQLAMEIIVKSRMAMQPPIERTLHSGGAEPKVTEKFLPPVGLDLKEPRSLQEYGLVLADMPHSGRDAEARQRDMTRRSEEEAERKFAAARAEAEEKLDQAKNGTFVRSNEPPSPTPPTVPLRTSSRDKHQYEVAALVGISLLLWALAGLSVALQARRAHRRRVARDQDE